jgi:uncharacterized RDD family membrane protein YckC
VVSRRDLGSWLEGPPQSNEQNWPGQRLGLPRTGPGSIARPGRRIVALMIDWGLSYLIAGWLFGGAELSILAIFAVEQLLLVGTLGYSIGHRIMGIAVRKPDGSAPGPLAAVVRTVLLCLVIPAVIFDQDKRGLHDRAMSTLLVRM